MKISIISFTNKGMLLSKKLQDILKTEYEVILFAKYKSFCASEEKEQTGEQCEVKYVDLSLNDWTLNQQQMGNTLIFIGAMGIAVRAIAEGIKDKLKDAPVLVIDEAMTFVIPVVAGHVGGANILAKTIADNTGAIPVITTATDVEGCFSVDLFAKENNLAIVNRDGIAKVSAKALENKPVRISIENYPPKETDVCVSRDKNVLKSGVIGLCPKQYALGVGCRKDTPYEKIRDILDDVLKANEIDINEIGALASIDLKVDEEGLIALSENLKIPFVTFTPELLLKAKGEYEESEFVLGKTGVGNVCERAAMLLTGNQGEIIVKKYAKDGVTVSLAKTMNLGK